METPRVYLRPMSDQEAGQPPEAGSTVAELAPEAAPPVRRRMPGWAVLLHNDDVNEFRFVARSVVELARLSAEDAVVRTIEAHESGVSLLLVTHREHAELIQEQFQSRGLTVTIEPAS